MSTRIATSLFRRLVRWFETSYPEHPARRNLVPDRFSGSKAISIYYRVEEISSVKDYSIKIKQQLQAYYRLFQGCLLEKKMMSDKEEAGTVITPPSSVRGMRTLNKSLFSHTITVPALKVPSRHISAFAKTLRVALFKMQRVKPVAELAKDDPLHSTHKLFLLDPKKFKTIDDFSEDNKKKLSEFGVSVEELSYFDLKVGYENWNVSEILRAVLPETSDGVSSYSIIGHIAHLNLKPEVLDYKHLIGEVILDKNSSVKTVVNKVNTIDNTYRNFQMELLAGEDNLVTRTKENGCVFEMDFSKVYWNPRLSTEHERVVELLKPGDILYDVFAGVGPFAIPAAKRGVMVFANDLNPHSYAALNTNVKLNKVKADRLKSYNLDGREFILTVLKLDLMARVQARACHGDWTRQSGSAENTALKPVSETGVTDSEDQAANVERSDEKVERSDEKVTETAAEGTDKNPVTNSSELQQQGTAKCSKEQHSVHSTEDTSSFRKLYITMNLPALAVEFLDSFCGLLADFPRELQSHPSVLECLPTVTCYCFENKNEGMDGDVKSRAEKIMGHKLPADTKVRFVRNVAPSKEMMCLEFQLTSEVLFGESVKPAISSQLSVERSQAEEDQPPMKKQRFSEAL